MESACQRPNRGRDALGPGSRRNRALRPGAGSFRRPNRGQDALGPEDPLRSREPAGAGVAPRTEGVPPSHGAQRRSSRRCKPPRRTLVSCLSAPRRAGVGTSMEQIPKPPLEGAFQQPNRGQDALAPGFRSFRATTHGARASRPRTARSAVGPSIGHPMGNTPVPCTSAPRCAGMEARMKQIPKHPLEGAFRPPNRGRDALVPGDNAGAVGQRRDQAGRPGPRASCPLEGAFRWPNRGRDALAPGDNAGAVGQRRDQAGRPGPRASCPLEGAFRPPNRGRDALAPGDNAGAVGQRRDQAGRPGPRASCPLEGAFRPPNRGRDALAPGDNAGAVGQRRDQAGRPGPRASCPLEGAFRPPNRGRDALAPGDNAGAVGQRRDQAGRPGPRASCPRTARSAVPSRDGAPVRKRMLPAGLRPGRPGGKLA